MTEPHRRYVGVAKVAAGPPPPAGNIVDLTGARYAAPAPPVSAPPDRNAKGRARLHVVEITAWVAALGVVVAIGAFLVTRASTQARWVMASSDPRPVVPLFPSASPAAVCIFDSCAGPRPTGTPARVRIASIGVESELEPLTLDERRHLQPPVDYARAGWYSGGVAPGDPGPAVIAGHVDSWRGAGVFFRLHTLRPGDTVEVSRSGAWLTFQVTAVEQYPKNQFPTSKVYNPTPDAQLRVITCGGDFDEERLTYRDNIVVYAVLTHR